MLITQEFIDTIAPEHGRTSCSDTDTSNGYGGQDGYNPKTGEPNIRYPRCNRCYLLNHIGEDTANLEFVPVIEYKLVYKGPK